MADEGVMPAGHYDLEDQELAHSIELPPTGDSGTAHTSPESPGPATDNTLSLDPGADEGSGVGEPLSPWHEGP
jgi:hypothetical protein